MLTETKKRTSRKWRGALVCLALLGAAPGAWGTLQAADTTTSNPVVGSNEKEIYSITKDAEIDVQALETEGVWQWFSTLSGKRIVNSGDNSLGFTLTTDSPDQGMFFTSNMVLKSDWLTLKPTVLADDSSKQVNKIVYGGTTSGDGGLRLDIGTGATFYVNGELGHAYTDVKSGTLDVSGSSASQVELGGLTSDGAGIVYSGTKDLIVDFDSDSLVFNGTLQGSGSGATVYKSGSGTWTANLAYDSAVESIQVQEGVFSLGANHYDYGSFGSNDFEIVLEKKGEFDLNTTDGATLTLNNLDASQGGTILIGEKDALYLSYANESAEIAANLSGAGCLAMDNVIDDDGKVTPWVLSGDNSKWTGIISAGEEKAEITLTTAKSGTANMTIALGSYGKLNVEKSTSLGTLKLAGVVTTNIAFGKTLTLGALELNEGALAENSCVMIDGGGTLAINESVANDHRGFTLVEDGSTLLVKSDGVNDAEVSDIVDETTRGFTTLTEGGVLALDYSGDSFTEANSFWKSEVSVDGEGGITLKSDSSNGAIKWNEKISFVGEGNSNLTFTAENACAILQNEFGGDGTLTKKGNGMAILDGSGSISNVVVSKGILQLLKDEEELAKDESDLELGKKENSQLANSNVFINGGTLTGWTKTLGSVNITSGALATMGTDVVGLTNSGSAFSMSGGAVYVGVVDADNYTRFKTNDENATVDIKSGAFYVDTSECEIELEEGATLKVIESAAGNMNANVSKIAIYDDIAHKRFVVDSDALNDGVFALVLKDSKFTEFARTTNQKSTSVQIDKLLDNSHDQDVADFFSALENSASKNSSALDQTTGEMRFSAMSAQVQTRNLIRQTLTRAVLPSTSVSGIDASTLRGQTDDGIGFAGWMDVLGAFGDVHNHKGASGYDYSMLGGVWGVELGSSTANQFGLYYSYNSSQANTKKALGKAKISDNIFGLYLRVSDSWGYTLGSCSLGAASYKFNRYTSLQDYARQSFNGKTDGWSDDICLERGFTFDLSNSQLQPYTGLQFTHLQADAFTESGTLKAVALRTDKMDYDSFQGTLGLRYLQSVQIAANDLEWNAYVNWTHEYLDANPEGAVAMVGAPDGKIRVIGNGAGRDWFYIGAGGTYELNDSFDIFAGGDVQLNSYLALVNGNAGFRYRW